jgi:heme/copper-type cytochrome/quinol oxidase subunit 3
MVKAFAAVLDGDQGKLKIYLLGTILLGMFFVSVQAVEYVILAGEGFRPHCTEALAAEVANCHLYGSTFYTMTGFHGTHVTIGVLCLWFVFWKALRGNYSPQDYGGVEIVGLYWHFVDLVWIILFTIVYLI